MTSLKPKKIAPNTLLFKGSPTTLVYLYDDKAVVIDPGIPKSRGKLIQKALRKYNVKEIEVIITHGHPDHIAALSTLTYKKLYSTILEAGLIENFTHRVLTTFGLPLHKYMDMLLFEADEYKVTNLITPGDKIGDIQTLHLPGHTLGQIGVILPSNIIYLADSLFGDRLLNAVGIPYIEDHKMYLETLEKLKDEVISYDKIIASHAPQFSSTKEVIDIIEYNIQHVNKIKKLIADLLSRKAYDIESLTLNILYSLDVDPTPSLFYLGQPLIKSIISELVEEDKVDIDFSPEKVVYRYK